MHTRFVSTPVARHDPSNPDFSYVRMYIQTAYKPPIKRVKEKWWWWWWWWYNGRN